MPFYPFDRLGGAVGFLAILLIAATPTQATAAEPSVVDTWIAKSTFANLADAQNLELQPNEFVYFPPGTRFLAFDKTINYRGLQRRLILTETGLWSYIPNGDAYFWKPQENKTLFGSSTVAIIRSRQPIDYQLSSDVKLQIWFTPSEIYKVNEESADGIEVTVDARKLGNVGPNVIYKVKIPYPLATLIRPSDLSLNRSDLQAYQRSIKDNIIGIQKACDTKTVRTVTLGGGFGVDLAKWFSSLKLEASAEQKTVEDFGTDVNVTRWYYARENSWDTYRITKKQDCKTGKQNYSYVSPAGSEIEFRQGRDDQKDFSFDTTTGRVQIRCADDYFKLAEYLDSFGFSQSEIPFVIAKTARITNPSNAARCRSDE